MQTKDANVVALIRSWAGTTECDNYKDMAAEMASAIRERAQDLEDATEFGRSLTPTEAEASAIEAWWAWYNEISPRS